MVDPDVVPFGAPSAPRFVPACLHLRCKTQFYRQADMEQPPGAIADSDRLSYWCARTHDHVGPDLEGCGPRACQRPRGCFEAARDLA